MKSLLSRATPFLKVAFAVALLTWMARSGRLSLSQVGKAWEHWPILMAVMGLMYIQVAVASWRWKYLLHAQDVLLPYGEAFSLTMIGALFNIVIPGAVGGDVMKGYYVSRRAGPRRSHALTTILMDRVLGLVGLALLAAVAAVWKLSGGVTPELRGVCYLAIFLAASGVIGLIVMTQAAVKIKLNPNGSRLLGLVEKLLDTFRPYHRNPWVLPVAVGVSMICHGLACYGFNLSTNALGGTNIALKYFFLVVPLGLMTTALPVSPAGIGVGQAAFFTLFRMVPGATPELGSNACTVYQSVMVVVYLTGFYPYLMYKEKRVDPAVIAAQETPARPAS